MSYSGSTYYFSIPYMKQGDILNEEDEQRKTQIIDGLLYSATLGGSNCVIDDAVYTLSGTTSNPATLLLTSDSESVVTAIVGKRIAVVDSPVSISVPRGGFVYVYLRTLEGIDTDPTACEITGLEEEVSSDGMILLATVDYTGTHAVLDTGTGKTYLTSIQRHIEDNEDPHGGTLLQTKLEVGNELKVKGTPVHGCVYMDVTTGGTDGTVVTVEGFMPLFVSAMKTSPDVGEVYFGVQENVVTVFNTGNSGIQIKVRIEG